MTRTARQIEKDERFWVVLALLGLYHSDDRARRFAEAHGLAFDSKIHR